MTEQEFGIAMAMASLGLMAAGATLPGVPGWALAMIIASMALSLGLTVRRGRRQVAGWSLCCGLAGAGVTGTAIGIAGGYGS